MKKIVIMAMLAMAASVFAPLMPSAHAATADDVLAQLLAQNPNTAQVQEVLALKQDLEQGGRGAIVSRVTQAALERAGQGKYAGLVNEVASGGDIRTALATTARQEITAQLATRFAPYNDSMSLLAQLLQNGGLIPQTARAGNALAAVTPILQ